MKIGIVIVSVVAVMAAGYAFRNFMFWESSVDNIVDARNALDDNLVLLDAGLIWERENGFVEGWTAARAERMAELKKELDTMNAEFNKLDKLPMFDRVLFSKHRAQAIRALATHWSLKRRESIVGIAEFLGESQHKR